MLQSTINNIIIKVKTKWIDNFDNILRMAALNPQSMLNPADYVQIRGEVVSIPKSISKRIDYEGYSTSDIRVGDTAIFSNQVIGTTTQLEPDAEPVFKNRLYYNGEEYFMSDIQHIYAVVRNRQIRMQNGYVMVADMEKPPLIILATQTKKSISSAQAKLTHIGRCLTTETPIDAMPGDTVFYNPNKLLIYQVPQYDMGKNIGSIPFGILKQSHILGKQIPDYKNFAS